MRRRVPRLAIALAVIAVALLGVRLALDPIAAWRTRVVLQRLEGMHGTFSNVRVRRAGARSVT